MKKVFLLLLATFFLFFSHIHGTLAVGGGALAQVSAPTLSPDQLTDVLPEEVQGLVEGAKQLSDDIATRPLGSIQDIYNRADQWFFETTGLHFREVLKGVLNLVVGILSILLDLLKRVLTLMQ